ncbi:ribonuclease H-like domain-containing protein [Tanacetum coccineum]
MHDLCTLFVKPIRVSLVYKRNPRHRDLEEEHALTRETFALPTPKTAKQLAAKRNQERVKSIFAYLANLMKYPPQFSIHNVADAKSLWAAIKARFRGNEESKKMQKNVLKHQFENFTTASNESLDKAYDRFQKLISQLEVHGAPISKEDINQKFLRSLPPSWNQIALIMRNKPDIDEIDIDDLYNNLRVYEDEMKRSSSSTSTSQNLAFLSSENTSSTNEVSTASGDFGVSTAGGISQVSTTSCAHDVVCSFFAQPTTSPQLENEDFQQIDEKRLKEMDLRWQVAMLTVRVKKFIQKTGRNLDFKEKQQFSIDKSKIECYNCHRKGHFARDCRSKRNQWRRSYGDNGRSNAPQMKSSSQGTGLDEYAIRKKIIESKHTDPNTNTKKTCRVQNMTTTGTRAVVNTGKGKMDTDLKKGQGNPEILLQDHVVVDSGCSSHMTSNKAYLSDSEDYNGGFVAFRSDPKGGLENQLNHNVKIIRCDNGTEFKNHAMNELCAKKGIKMEFSVARTPQQNVNIACIVQIGKFDGKSDEGYLLGYSTTSKAFRVYNKRTKRVEENLHIDFVEDQPNVARTGPN